MRGTAPKSGINEILKSGTIHVFARASQMLTLASRKQTDSSSDGETLADSHGWYEEEKQKIRKKKNGGSDAEDGKEASVEMPNISWPITDKAGRVMGIKACEIHVTNEVDVESVLSQDVRGLVREGGKGR